MIKHIEIELSNTNFYKLFMDGQYIGCYGNPCKAMTVAMEKLGYTQIDEPCNCRQFINLGRCEHV